MFDIDSIEKIYLSPELIDGRKGIHSFAAMVSGLKLEDNKNYIFLFASKSGKAVKIFYKDKTGYWLSMKVLDDGKFLWPKDAEEALYLSKEELTWLLSGNKMIRTKAMGTMKYY